MYQIRVIFLCLIIWCYFCGMYQVGGIFFILNKMAVILCHVCCRYPLSCMLSVSFVMYVVGILCHVCCRYPLSCMLAVSFVMYVVGILCHVCWRYPLSCMLSVSFVMYVVGILCHVCWRYPLSCMLAVSFGEFRLSNVLLFYSFLI
jgi:hypothetical protein